MEIKELEEGEISKVVQFYSEVMLSAEEKKEGMEIFKEKIEKSFKKDHMLIALENDELVAFSWAQIQETAGRKVDKVIMMLISPDRYGVGIGGQLIEKEREYAKKMGADVLDIETG